jgi:predicted RNase H-like HicB family nuclease
MKMRDYRLKVREAIKRALVVRYLIIIEQAGQNLSAYAPDLPGCVTTGKRRDEVVANMPEAIALHLKGLLEDGEPIPTPNSDPEFVDVSLPSPIA